MKFIFKYIVVDDGAILFPESVVHSMVARGFQNEKIFSAGFCAISFIDNSIEVKCFGESSSLKIQSIPLKDQQMIADLFSMLSRTKYLGFRASTLYDTQ